MVSWLGFSRANQFSQFWPIVRRNPLDLISISKERGPYISHWGMLECNGWPKWLAEKGTLVGRVGKSKSYLG